MTTLEGIPRVSRGMKAPWAAELLAASGAATPSMAPLPNSSGMLGDPFFDGIGDKRGNDGASSRKDAQEETEDRSPDDGPDGFAPILAGWAEALSLWS